MSGMYGTVKPADININSDVEIFYNYRPSYNEDETNMKDFRTLTPSSVLEPCESVDGNILSGLYNLKLPLTTFKEKGIYTIYIRPKEIDVTISDVGYLAAYTDIRGVVFNVNDNLSNFSIGNTLVGYRIEYLDSKGKKDGNYKIITSSNRAEAINVMLNNASDKGVKYRYTMSGSVIFCTVTPSLAPTFKPTDLPNIGISGQKVKLVNTKFNPIMIEIEMVEHDDETITNMLEGNQLIDKDHALITTFNPNGEIYHQSEYGAYKDEYGNPLYEFKKNRDNIDFNQSFTNLGD